MKPGSLLSLLSLLSLVLLVALLAPPAECRLGSELVLAGEPAGLCGGGYKEQAVPKVFSNPNDSVIVGPLCPSPPAQAKFGECPVPRRTSSSKCGNFCSTNENCPGSELCCSNGCGTECMMPTGAKAGFCPRVKSDMMSICLVRCSSDSDCEGDEKCCSMACHVHCVRPVPAKPGVCPKRRLRYTLLPCNNTCSDDSDCPGRDKCCFTGCSLGCMAPARRKGYSPAASLLGWGWGCRQCPALIASPVLQSDICHLPPERGPCMGLFYRYAYSPATGTCRLFLYGGCRGNANNFETLGECQRVCQRGRASE